MQVCANTQTDIDFHCSHMPKCALFRVADQLKPTNQIHLNLRMHRFCFDLKLNLVSKHKQICNVFGSEWRLSRVMDTAMNKSIK